MRKLCGSTRRSAQPSARHVPADVRAPAERATTESSSARQSTSARWADAARTRVMAAATYARTESGMPEGASCAGRRAAVQSSAPLKAHAHAAARG
jgi:hypothetical protein